MALSAEFEVDLEDGVSSSAEAAEQSLESLREEVYQATSELRRMESAMRSLRSSTSASASTMGKLRDQIGAQRARVAGLQERYVQLGGDFKRANRAGGEQIGIFERLIGATEGLGGSAGESAGRVRQLQEGLGKLGGRGGAIVAVLTVLGVLLYGVAAKLAATGIAAANAARDFFLLAKAATGSAFQAGQLGAAVERVSRLVPTAKAELQGMALELGRAGLQGRALEDALGAAAVAGSTLGAEVGGKILDLVKKWQAAGKAMATAMDFEGAGVSLNEVASAMAGNLGISFDEARKRILEGKASVEEGLEALNRAVRAKLGGTAQEQLLSLGAQAQRAKANLGEIFAGVEVGPFLRALQSLLGMLDASTASGRMLRAMARTILQPLIDSATEAMPTIKAFVGGFIEAMGQFTANVRRAQKWLDQFDAPGLPPLLSAAQVGKAIFAGLAVVLGVVYGAFKLVGFVLGLLLAPFKGVAHLVKLAISALMGLPAAASGAASAVSDFVSEGVASLGDFASSALQAGSDFVAGIIEGITGKAGELVSAVSDLASKAVGAFKSKLDIKSPSGVMRREAREIPAGGVEGIKDGEDEFQRAAENMISIPAGESAPAPKPRGAAGGDVTITVPLTLIFEGGAGATPEEIARHVVEQVERAVEQAVGMVPA